MDRQIGDKEVTQAFSRLVWMLDPSCVLVGASCDKDYVCDSWLTYISVGSCMMLLFCEVYLGHVVDEFYDCVALRYTTV